METKSTADDRGVVVCNKQRRWPWPFQLSVPESYFCRILRLSSQVLRVGPDGFLESEEEDNEWEWEDEDAGPPKSPAACRCWGASKELTPCNDSGCASGSPPPLLGGTPGTNKGSMTSTGPPKDNKGARSNAAAKGLEMLVATCRKSKYATIVRFFKGKPVVYLDLQADKIFANRKIKTPVVDQKMDEIVNYNGLYPASPEDPESFKNNFLEVKRSPVAGFGVFARRDIKVGEVLLVERALIVADQSTIYDALDELTPAQREAFSRLHTFVRTPNDLCDGKRYATFRTNSFAIPRSPSPSPSPSHPTLNAAKHGSTSPRGTVSALFLVASRFNHACYPRSSVDYWYDTARRSMAFRASRPVAAGEELTISYSRLPHELHAVWGFYCACGACLPMVDEDGGGAENGVGVGGKENLAIWG
ncbi:hypothetical protein F4810DRAFT_711870 [Camillea tinctor]|nr:hypothetical protein F4810DRAFT_711870 [Camillea tinctor]